MVIIQHLYQQWIGLGCQKTSRKIGWKLYLFQLLKILNDDISSSEEQYFSRSGFPPPARKPPEAAYWKDTYLGSIQVMALSRILRPVTMESAFLESTPAYFHAHENLRTTALEQGLCYLLENNPRSPSCHPAAHQLGLQCRFLLIYSISTLLY